MDTVVITPEEPRPAVPTREGDEPTALDDLRAPGADAEHDEFRARLHACAVQGDGDQALDVLAEMEAAGYEAESADHLLVLVAFQLRGRGEEAEAYWRTLPPAMVTDAHLRAVLAAYALRRRAGDVERLYREFEAGSVPPGDECRVVLLTALRFAGDAAGARRWMARWRPAPDDPAFSRLVAGLVAAHAEPAVRGELTAIYESLTDAQRGDPEIALALVDAFAKAGDPERAEACLGAALSGVDDPEERAALVVACVEAYCRSVEPAVGRLLDAADEAGIELEERTFLVRGPEQ